MKTQNKKNFLALLALLLGSVVFVYAAADQPKMEAARSDLNGAKTELQRALHDKAGHRAQAIGLVNSAISEVNQGIRFARRNNHAEASSDLFAGAPADQPHMRAGGSPS